MTKLTNSQIKAAFAKARAAQQAGKLDQAERAYAKLVAAAPQLAEVHFNLGELHALSRRLPQAAQSFEAALKLRPSEPAIWVAYLMMASRHPNPKNFDILRGRAAPVLHGTAQFAYFEGLALQRLKDWAGAAKHFEAAQSGGYRQPQVYSEYGLVLSELGKSKDALAQFDQALALAPKNDLILYRKAEHLRKIGDLDAAKVAAQATIDAAPQMGGPYALYVSLGKVATNDANIARMRKALASKRADDPDVTTLCTALGKAMEDTGQTSKVFAYLNRGNAVAAKAYPYDKEAAADAAARIKAIYQEVRDIPAPQSDAAPIFITGAPRSGTSLVEQILSAHSQVEGGGELGLLQPKVGNCLADHAASAPLLTQLKSLADEFGGELAKLFPQASHVTDKSISTFSYIGLLHKVMPKARFIVVRRDPRDNALSIYKNRFKDGLHRYSNDLAHIAFFLRQFEEFVDFWREACPQAVYEIRYEDLIAEPEAKSKELVQAAGLEWEDACLSFYTAKRAVRTLSSAQVRQPIYSSSVGAWAAFEQDLAPFLKVYGALN